MSRNPYHEGELLVQQRIGEVEEPLDPPDEGAVLICCAKPTIDVLVDV